MKGLKNWIIEGWHGTQEPEKAELEPEPKKELEVSDTEEAYWYQKGVEDFGEVLLKLIQNDTGKKMFQKHITFITQNLMTNYKTQKEIRNLKKQIQNHK